MSPHDEFVIPFENLPDGFAETIEDPPDVPVEPRAAATIVLLRDGAEDMEILLMRRSRKAGFAPGAYVFPGGRVDTSDALPSVVSLLDDLDPDTARQRLEHNGEPPAIAYYLAALREAFEETGIMVGLREDGSAPPTAAEDPDVDEIRDALMGDRIGFHEAIERLGCRIAGDAIEYIAHWITPEPEPRRYDTRFFAAKVRAGATAIIDPREMTDALWLSPGDALARLDRGELPMVFPTIKTIEALSRYDSADEALEGYGAEPVRTILPTLVVTPTGIGLEIDEEV
ncbi:MAG: NUDIX hydrolase [Longimicrobiales bacterium]